jgi:PAP2 superfamily
MKHIAAAIGVLVAVTTTTTRADTITDWNETAIAVLKTANVTGNPWTRHMAMVHVAMSDAVNSVQGKYARYVAKGELARDASPEAAASSAARHVLLQAYPNQKAAIDEAHARSITGIPEGPAKTAGLALGEQLGALVIADRAADGTSAPDSYRPVTTPGVWLPTAPPIFAQYAQAKPWVLRSADQFRPGPPPQLNGAIYARDYNETKNLGGAKSTARTAEQNDAVKFWTQQNISPAWQEAARQISAAKGLGLAENARLFALLNMSMANTFINDWDAKFTYNFWRPVTAIRNGDQDGNDATERDAGWSPSNATPMHPEYPSQAAIVAGSSAAILELVIAGAASVPFTATDLADPKLTRTFTSITQLSNEQCDVRVWGGIHFRNSLEVGVDMGRRMSAYLVENSLKPSQ